MAASGEELIPRPGGGFKSLSRKYVVDVDPGSSTPEADVFAWVLANAPATITGLVLNDVWIEESGEIKDQWDATAQYGETELQSTPPASGAMEYRFNFQAQGGHFYQSLETVLFCTGDGCSADPTEVDAEDFHGAINVVNDGGKNRCEGQQIDPPAETFTLAYYPVNAVVDAAYQTLVEGMCGCVNDDEFRGKPAGSLMLVRVSGGVRTNDDWSIEFGFAYIPNDTEIPVGPNITVDEKEGMDLLWAYYKPVKGDKELIKRPKAAYVERVWRRADFSLLGLPS
jgi:hypothetical protein